MRPAPPASAGDAPGDPQLAGVRYPRSLQPEEPVPEIRPFRALRFEPEAVGDLSQVVSPPYDVISAAHQRALLARHARNVVRLDLPPDEPGDGADDKYRRAAH